MSHGINTETEDLYLSEEFVEEKVDSDAMTFEEAWYIKGWRESDRYMPDD